MTAKRDELIHLIETLPEDQVEEFLADARRRTSAKPKNSWPLKFVGMIKNGLLTDRPPSPEAAYPDGMVNPALQSAIEAMSLDERLELVEYIESMVESAPIEVTEEQRAMIRSRKAELQADPSIGLTWDELKARLAARRA
jgi:putative addiction module component (TIGR02574 family)